MKITTIMGALWAAGVGTALSNFPSRNHPVRRANYNVSRQSGVITPKVVIVTMFSSERDVWLSNSNKPGGFGNLCSKNVTVPGFSPLYSAVNCLSDDSVCLLTIGEGEINAAVTMTALMLSPLFDLRKTYFLISGIAGVNPNHGTTGSVAFARYAVQVALQYEIDPRELGLTDQRHGTGYIPQGAQNPGEYPSAIYGTEVYELNASLRDLAVKYAHKAKLNDSAVAAAYRQNYHNPGHPNPNPPAVRKPGIIRCDVTTSDVYFSGALLSASFENTTTLFTNGSGTYCMTAQEDNAILGALIRGASSKLLDFSRIVLMRAGANFDRPFPGSDARAN
ncbi:Purine nucleoside permease, partial [Lachnellula suecica]